MTSLPGVIELGGSSRLDFDQAPHYDYAQHIRYAGYLSVPTEYLEALILAVGGTDQ